MYNKMRYLTNKKKQYSGAWKRLHLQRENGDQSTGNLPQMPL